MSSAYSPNATSAYNPNASAPSKGGSNKTYIIIGVVVFASIVVVAIIVGIVVGTASDDASSTDYIEISIQSSNTKEKWMEDMVTKFNANSSVNQLNGKTIRLTLHNTGSSFKSQYSANIWSPANTQYITLYEQENNVNFLSSESTYCRSVTDIPVGVAMWKKLAVALGWNSDTRISFAELAEIALADDGWASVDSNLASYGSFKYAHGHPDESNSGRLSVVANMLALSNATADDGLDIADVEQAILDEDVIAVEQAVVHLGKIDTAILERMLEHGPTYIHAVANYESNVINWNQDYADQMLQWNDKWVFVYLEDGTFWINHPLCVLDEAEWTSIEQRDGALQFIEWATKKENLQELLQYGIRPKSSSGITDLTCCGSTITKANGADPTQNRETVPNIPYPDDDVMAKVLKGWHLIKKPAAFALVVDTSGSMGLTDEGYSLPRLSYAKTALYAFVNSTDPQDYIMTFSFKEGSAGVGPEGNKSNSQIAIDNWVAGLKDEGQTPLYRTIDTAFDAMTALKEENEAKGIDWNYAIVAMTDGAATDGVGETPNRFDTTCDLFTDQAGISDTYCDLNDALEGKAAFSQSSDIVHLFPIVFGEDPGAIDELPYLKRLADIASGANFSADADELSDVYYLISLEL